MSDPKDDAVLRKWSRIREEDEALHKSATSQMKKFFGEAVKQDVVRARLKQELEGRVGEVSRYREDQGGFSVDNEPPPTGTEDVYWNKK